MQFKNIPTKLTHVVDNFFTADGAFRGISAFINFPDIAVVEAIKELALGLIFNSVT